MPNRNYEKGVRFERSVMQSMNAKGFNCTRASGSHSKWDVIAYDIIRKPIFIQCKVTQDQSEIERLIRDFRENTKPSKFYHQALFVKRGHGMSSVEEIYV